MKTAQGVMALLLAALVLSSSALAWESNVGRETPKPKYKASWEHMVARPPALCILAQHKYDDGTVFKTVYGFVGKENYRGQTCYPFRASGNARTALPKRAS
jgi:hypothetical protein